MTYDYGMFTAISPELPGRAYRSGNRAEAVPRMRREEVRAVMRHGAVLA